MKRTTPAAKKAKGKGTADAVERPASPAKRGRPLATVDMVPKRGKRSNEPSKDAQGTFFDRELAESYLGRKMDTLAADYQFLSGSWRTEMMACEEKIQEYAKHGNPVPKALLQRLDQCRRNFRAVIRDETVFTDTQVKRFEMLTALNKPMNEEERFTPIRFVLNGRDLGADVAEGVARAAKAAEDGGDE